MNEVPCVKEHFYLDTNVYWRLPENNDQNGIALLKRNRKRLRLTATTIIELIEDLHTCAPARFDLHKKAVELARDAGKGGILPASSEFVARRVFNTSFGNATPSIQTLRRCLDLAVRYRSQGELGGPVRVGAGWGRLDVAFVARQMQQMRSDHVQQVRAYKSTALAQNPKGTLPDDQYCQRITSYYKTPEWKRSYVRGAARGVGCSGLSDAQLDQLAPLLQAACEFVGTILRQSICEGYRYWKKANDVMDQHHLQYLCDPTLTFVTEDGKLRSKVSVHAGQRVIGWPELEDRLQSGK